MGSIINKSNHPVLIKKVFIHVWTLRQEIERAIEIRLNESKGLEKLEDINIDDIKSFYSNLNNFAATGPVADDSSESEESTSSENLDSSGNPMDDDALAMMAALNGEDETDNTSDEQENDTDEKTEGNDEADGLEESDLENGSQEEDDDEAQKLALEMLGDQGASDTSKADTSTDDGSDDDAAALAAQMLEGQVSSPPLDEDLDSKEDDKDDVHGKSASSEQIFSNALRPTPVGPFINKGFVFLTDLDMDQVLIFTRKSYNTGSNIIIEFQIPQSFKVTAEVVATFTLNRNSRVISSTKPNYRIQCKLIYSFDQERSKLRSFLEQIEPEIPPPPSKLKKPDSSEEEDEDEFDDLGL